MEESNLVEGHQELRKPLVYGQSLTDPCLGWDDSVHLLDALADSRRTPQAAREQGRLNSLARVLKDVMIGLKG